MAAVEPDGEGRRSSDDFYPAMSATALPPAPPFLPSPFAVREEVPEFYHGVKWELYQAHMEHLARCAADEAKAAESTLKTDEMEAVLCWDAGALEWKLRLGEGALELLEKLVMSGRFEVTVKVRAIPGAGD